MGEKKYKSEQLRILRERKNKLDNRIKLEEKKLKERERKERTQRLIKVGTIVSKIEIDSVEYADFLKEQFENDKTFKDFMSKYKKQFENSKKDSVNESDHENEVVSG